MGCQEFDTGGGLGRTGSRALYREREAELQDVLLAAASKTCGQNNCNCPGARTVRAAAADLTAHRAVPTVKDPDA